MSDNLRELAEERVDKKIKFYTNLKSYIFVNTILTIINAWFTPNFWWVLFPAFFWGVGLVIDFLKAFIFMDYFNIESYREQKIQDELEKLRD